MISPITTKMILNYFKNVNKGSSPLPAHGSGGARATINLIAAEKISAPKRGRLGRRGSGGGMPSRPSVVAPPPDSTEAEPSKILFTFFSFARLLKIFSIKEKSILLGGERMRAAAGRERTISFRATTRGARGQSGFSAKKVRISSKQYRIITN